MKMLHAYPAECGDAKPLLVLRPIQLFEPEPALQWPGTNTSYFQDILVIAAPIS